MTAVATDRQQLIQDAYRQRELLDDERCRAAVGSVIADLDEGRLRVTQKEEGGWRVNGWIKEAILLYFAIQEVQPSQAGPLRFNDKIPLKDNYERLAVRAVPPAAARYGSFMEPDVVLMPSYVNIGAYIGARTMIDNWALVGSCAQIGANVHVSAGAIIGGVLEPAHATPVIIEDGAFIGAGCNIVEGVIVEEEAVIGANVSLTASTRIVDVRGAAPVTYKGRVPRRAIVVGGSVPKQFAAGCFHIQCALIIGTRDAATDRKTSLNEALRQLQE